MGRNCDIELMLQTTDLLPIRAPSALCDFSAKIADDASPSLQLQLPRNLHIQLQLNQ